MSRAHNLNKADCRRLYRNGVDIAHRVDHSIKEISIAALLQPPHVDHRLRLRAICEQLLLSDDEDMGKMIEDVMWKKELHEDLDTKTAFANYLLSAIDFYKSFLRKLGQAFNIDLTCVFLDNIDSTDDDTETAAITITSPKVDWAKDASGRCLIYIGDLARYYTDYDSVKGHEIALEHYHKAMCFRPDWGISHNQLGTLHVNFNFGLDTIYYYMRCLYSTVPFDGIINNVKRHISKTYKEMLQMLQYGEPETITREYILKRLVINFIYLNSNLSPNTSMTIEQLNELCEKVIKDFKEYTAYGFEFCENESLYSVKPDADYDLVDCNILFKLLAVLYMSEYNLSQMGAPQETISVAIIIAVLTRIAQCVTYYITYGENEQDLDDNDSASNALKTSEGSSDCHEMNNYNSDNDKDDPQTKKMKAKKLLYKKARARRRRKTSDSEDESSDNNEDYSDSSFSGSISHHSDSESRSLQVSSSSEWSTDSENSESELVTDTEENIIENNTASGEVQPVINVNNHTIGDVVDSTDTVNPEGSNRNDSECEVATDQPDFHVDIEKQRRLRKISNKLLNVLKIGTDWLISHEEVLDKYQEDLAQFWSDYATLLNCIIMTYPQAIQQNFDQIDPLPEDIYLLGFKPLERIHINIKPNSRNLQKIAKSDLPMQGLIWVANECQFYGPLQLAEYKAEVTVQISKEEEDKAKAKRLQAMKMMAQMKLKSDVESLEANVASRDANKGVTISPYLVPDAFAFCNSLRAIQDFSHSGQLVIIVPLAVVQSLDNMKKISAQARQAIKYLEVQFKKGNRWLRAQNDNEMSSKIKRRKNQGQENWIYEQIIDCCCYFSEGKQNMVTLLTGIDLRNEEIAANKGLDSNMLELAKKQDVKIENIKLFTKKWKSYKRK
ncbi:uncharacterized protein TRIADDRAFT_54089 [Trichoplax adhaerens]|uniref:PIN domain-containing protein n=1 Tax=Trichoplax adhaerens TaxID=10228 RepID=B3RR29_TRIAD|nr:hypothetical protein TRIADDRAFT_54089 [Trichoplax adhaerens]EDV26270.1 hypothetical protein TRIADDRAFT_54089 [Trichoplax adhaerens]|eukprot:XP_002110266.1 hypothetical protein TRIADDRAFT_54089 [Trichoplax adhaerens]